MNSDVPTAAAQSLADQIVRQVESILLAAESVTRPVEVDPYREELFALFVTAHGAGFTSTGAPIDLSSDGLCIRLAERWGLRNAAQQSFQAQQKLPNEQLAKMRLLWSVMRMWMEWEYAWSRWAEFHSSAEGTATTDPAAVDSTDSSAAGGLQ